MVRVIRDKEYAYSAGDIAVIHRLDPNTEGRPPSKYAVFWTNPLIIEDRRVVIGNASYWTTPDEVEFVAETLFDWRADRILKEKSIT